MSLDVIGSATTEMTEISERLTSERPVQACDGTAELQNELSLECLFALRYTREASRSI
jgi:hypothetical protein